MRLELDAWFKPLIKAVPELTPVQVLEDFVELAFLCLLGRRQDALSVRCLAGHAERVEAFVAALTALGDTMERYRFVDVLGHVHQELRGLHSQQHTGSFYTPTPICEVMAEMTNAAPLQEAHAEAQERAACGEVYRVADPTVGAGRTLLSFAKVHCEKLPYFRFYGTDIEANACRMAFVNCALNGMVAQITHGNELTGEVWQVWRTPEWSVYEEEVQTLTMWRRTFALVQTAKEHRPPKEPVQGEFDFSF